MLHLKLRAVILHSTRINPNRYDFSTILFLYTDVDALISTKMHARSDALCGLFPFRPPVICPQPLRPPPWRWRILRIHVCTPRAQCYPRHACPLCASLLMQLHQTKKTRPALAPSHVFSCGNRMQIHARYACIAHCSLKSSADTGLKVLFGSRLFRKRIPW